MRATLLLCLALCLAHTHGQVLTPVWLDPKKSFAARARALVAALTPDERLAQLNSGAAAIPRLGIPAFDFWTGCAHGVAEFNAEGATLFPMPLGLAATFDTKLMLEVATVFGNELRGKANEAIKRGELKYTNCFDPNINIFRDPRWGRGAETFGEDPLLASRMVAAFVRGLQWGNTSSSSAGGATAAAAGPGLLATESTLSRGAAAASAASRGYLKAAATCKHFAAYSLEEHEGVTRMGFDAVVDPRDMADTYLPAFEACVREGVASIMCSYNAINGTPACANDWLLTQARAAGKLRNDWKFAGFVVSDCDAVEAISGQHAFAPGAAEGAAAALKAGTDLACKDYSPLKQALERGLVSQQQASKPPPLAGAAAVDAALTRLLVSRMRQGHFDFDPMVNPYAAIPGSLVGSPWHLALAREAAAKSVVLLKNRDRPPTKGGAPQGPTLPLRLERMRNITVVGPLAHQSELLLGNYYGNAAGQLLSPWDALQARVSDYNARLKGAGADNKTVGLNLLKGSEVIGGGAEVDKVAAACRRCDTCIFFLGTSMVSNDSTRETRSGVYDRYAPATEGEMWDRHDLLLPGEQLSLVQAAAKRTNATVVVVLLHGGPLDVSWLQASERVGAILTGWFPGQGAEGLVDVLLGDVSPSGRLPVTFYYTNYTDQASCLLGPAISMADMRMRPFPGRTHRFLRTPVLYPFGHGLSYAPFTHTLTLTPSASTNSSGPGAAWLEVGVKVDRAAAGGGAVVAADDSVLLFLSRRAPTEQAPEQPPTLTLEVGCQPAAPPPQEGDGEEGEGQQQQQGEPQEDPEAPVQGLVAFDRASNLKRGQSRTLRFRVNAGAFAAFNSGYGEGLLPPCGRYWLRTSGGAAAAVDLAPAPASSEEGQEQEGG